MDLYEVNGDLMVNFHDLMELSGDMPSGYD